MRSSRLLLTSVVVALGMSTDETLAMLDVRSRTEKVDAVQVDVADVKVERRGLKEIAAARGLKEIAAAMEQDATQEQVEQASAQEQVIAQEADVAVANTETAEQHDAVEVTENVVSEIADEAQGAVEQVVTQGAELAVVETDEAVEKVDAVEVTEETVSEIVDEAQGAAESESVVVETAEAVENVDAVEVTEETVNEIVDEAQGVVEQGGTQEAELAVVETVDETVEVSDQTLTEATNEAEETTGEAYERVTLTAHDAVVAEKFGLRALDFRLVQRHQDCGVDTFSLGAVETVFQCARKAAESSECSDVFHSDGSSNCACVVVGSTCTPTSSTDTDGINVYRIPPLQVQLLHLGKKCESENDILVLGHVTSVEHCASRVASRSDVCSADFQSDGANCACVKADQNCDPVLGGEETASKVSMFRALKAVSCTGCSISVDAN